MAAELHGDTKDRMQFEQDDGNRQKRRCDDFFSGWNVQFNNAM
ncbi:hypothetical protein AwEntero_28340 [Enterobacterales bacterium]|nr:hypothetical protein AwEntero_28340 [Enterobacterales bacterium]